MHKKIRIGENLRPILNSYLGMLRNTNGYKERKLVKAMLPNENFDINITKIMKPNEFDDGQNYGQRLINKIKNHKVH